MAWPFCLSFSIVTTLVILPIGVGAALLMNTPFPGRGVVRSIFLIPFVMPVFVNAITWRRLFMTGWGPIDRILATLHLAGANTFPVEGSDRYVQPGVLPHLGQRESVARQV